MYLVRITEAEVLIVFYLMFLHASLLVRIYTAILYSQQLASGDVKTYGTDEVSHCCIKSAAFK